MRLLKQSTAYDLMVFMADSTDHITGKASLTLTITASKAGGAFSSISPTVTERGNGWYSLALTTSHTDTIGDFALHVTGTGADPSDLVAQVRAKTTDDQLTAAQVNAEADTALSDVGLTSTVTGRIDAAVSTRLAGASYTAPLDAAGTRTAIGLASANLDTQLADLPTAAENAAALLDLTDGVETGVTPRGALRAVLSTLAGVATGGGSTSLVFKNPAGATTRVTLTVDADGNRSVSTLNL